MAADQAKSLRRFMQELRHHLSGWRQKAKKDFSAASYQEELKSLADDPVYSKFHLASPDYVIIRFMGRMSVSIGRRLGEIYDKIPRFAAQARYDLQRDQVIAKFGRLELDVRLCPEHLSEEDREHLRSVAQEHLSVDVSAYTGLGIEIRYNFNPNDSARLRKDADLVELLQAKNYYPVYLVFCENSPRLADAVARLRRAGWNFVIGSAALRFMADLVGFDIGKILDQPEVSAEIKAEVDGLMAEIRGSHALRQLKRPRRRHLP